MTGTAWTGVLREIFLQPKVSANKFLGYSSFFYFIPSLSLHYFCLIRNYNPDPSSNPATGYEELLLQEGGAPAA